MTRFKVAMVHMDPEELPAWVPETMANHDIEFVFEECETRAQLASCAGDADVVWVFGGSLIVTAESLADLPRCGALIRTGSGTDNMPIDAATGAGNHRRQHAGGFQRWRLGPYDRVAAGGSAANRHSGSDGTYGHLGSGGRLSKLASAGADAGADRLRPYCAPGERAN